MSCTVMLFVPLSLLLNVCLCEKASRCFQYVRKNSLVYSVTINEVHLKLEGRAVVNVTSVLCVQCRDWVLF